VIVVGASPTAVAVAIGLYGLRMFAITGFYHRYFAHRAFRTSRAFAFLMALVGASAAQRGPLWWAAHHRRHHVRSDEEDDLHSPRHRGFWRSHAGWFMTREAFATEERYVRDWLRHPELRLLNRFDWIAPALLLGALVAAGELLARFAPGLGTDGPQLAVWGFAISTVAVYHATFTINSLAHRWGRRRYATRDDSRNNLLLALLTLGEGWHNNHHHHAASARQGFYWWEIDLTYYGLVVLSWLGLVRDLRPVPARVRARDLVEEGRP
jgi:stearoyl-CoA desaturase (delta-9 desaturase)